MNTNRILSTCDYYEINREERHLAAIVFSQLVGLSPHSIKTLFDMIDERCGSWSINESEFGVYFEYALLRDWWAAPTKEKEIENNNAMRLDALRGMLDDDLEQSGAPIVRAIRECDAGKINKKLANSKFANSSKPVSPSQWSAEKIKLEAGNDQILYRWMMKVKMAFSIKPDVVIHFDREHAICIEMKLDSGLDAYKWDQKAAGGQKALSQTALQNFLFTRCLGLRPENVVQLLINRSGLFPGARVSHESSLIKTSSISPHDSVVVRTLGWSDFLEKLELAGARMREDLYLRRANGYARGAIGLRRT